MGDKTKDILNSRKNQLDEVSQDRNWRSYIANELHNADKWDNDWGFLSGKNKGKFGRHQLRVLSAKWFLKRTLELT